MKTKFNIHFIYVLLAATLWGTSGIFVRTLNSSALGQMDIVLGRAFFTFLILGAIILFKDTSLFKINPRDIWIFLLDGLFSIVLFNFSYYTTMSLTSLSVAAVLLYTAPFFVVILSLFLFGKKLTGKKCLACVVAFLGCCFVSGLFDSAHRISGKALFFGLLTGFGYALYTIFGDILIKKGYKTLTITFYVFLFATIGCLPFVNFARGIPALNSKSLLWIFLMAFFNTVLPYIFYTTGLTKVDATVAPIIATLEPVVATVVGVVFFKEHLTFLGAVGIVLVLFSVIVLNYKNKKVLKIKANAKINLSLKITGKRPDGYHLLDTVMQSVSLYDYITVKKTKGGVSLDCSNKTLCGEENIAFKAAKLFTETIKVDGGADIYIKKNIPEAAGLGGGSCDAAAVLVALDRLFETNLSQKALCNMAVKLGADVPFFIMGGTVRAEGIGEILTKLDPLKKGYFLLAKDDSKPSTKEMYHLVDSKDFISLDTENIISACANGDLQKLCLNMDNSFMAVWEGNKLYERLKKFSPLGVGLSGSGPTFFAVFNDFKTAEKCRKQLKKEKITAFVTKPLENSFFFE